MRIGLIDADLMDNGTRHPNLALMKIAGYYRDKGNEVKLIFNDYKEVDDYDKVFVSKVFSFTEIPLWILERPHVEYGGTGFFVDGGKSLDNDIEHHMPYYDLYKEYINEQLDNGKRRQRFADYLDYSIGFTTRGCFRKCSFCVNKKYDRVHRHSAVAEFLDKSRKYIYLWDDNILAYENWESVLDDIESTGKPFQFRQGVDLRLMTDKKAKRFNEAKYRGDFIFAFDHIKDKELIIEKVQLWKRYSSKVCKMYVISGYDSQDEKDIKIVFERIKILMKYGSLPYIMRYEEYKNSKYKGMYVQLARWCNQPNFFKKKSFREFCIANQEYHSNKNTHCAAYKAMLGFEHDFPEIAKQYFDMKFEDENMYSIQYGYGRRYANKPLCNTCVKKNITWDDMIRDSFDKKKFLQLYYAKEIDLQCCSYENSICKKNQEYGKFVCDLLLNTSIEEIIEALHGCEDLEKIEANDFPKFTSFSDVIFKIVDCLNEYKNCVFTYGELLVKLGITINDKEIKKIESNLKLAALLDLVQVTGAREKSKIRISELGKIYSIYNKEDRERLASLLLLRVPRIQRFALDEYKKEKDLDLLINNVSKELGIRGSNTGYMIQLMKKVFK